MPAAFQPNAFQVGAFDVGTQPVGATLPLAWRINEAVGATRTLSWSLGDFVPALGSPMRIVSRPVPARRWQVGSELVIAWRILAEDRVDEHNHLVALLEVDEDLFVMASRSR